MDEIEKGSSFLAMSERATDTTTQKQKTARKATKSGRTAPRRKSKSNEAKNASASSNYVKNSPIKRGSKRKRGSTARRSLGKQANSMKFKHFSVNKAITVVQPFGKKGKKMAGVVENLLFFAFIGLGLYFLISYQSHVVDGQSMAPTFHSGDRLLTHKRQEIRRYDIVTFEPEDVPGDSYVKRVIGLPGDQLYVDGSILYLLESESSEGLNLAAAVITGELPDGTQVLHLDEKNAAELGAENQIPKGFYLVLGDNRSHSTDSRSFGLVAEKQIEGVVSLRIFPLSRFGVVH